MQDEAVLYKFISGCASYHITATYSYVFERVRVTPFIRPELRNKSFQQIFNMWRYRGAFKNYWNPFVSTKMILLVPYGLVFPMSDAVQNELYKRPYFVDAEE